jgi:hypothetical protein
VNENDMQHKQQRLKQLREASQHTTEDITSYYERLIQEFEHRYPPLIYVEEIRLSRESMEHWVAQHHQEEV